MKSASKLAPAMALSLTILATAFAADAKLNRAGEPAVSFTAVGPAGMKIVGTTSELNVVDNGQALSVTVPLGNLKTGITLRDKHMRDKYLQVSSFPNAELQVSRSALKFPAAGADASGDVQGSLQLHGKTKPVTFHYTAKREGNVFHVSGSVHVNMQDFGMETPGYLGVTVKPDVDVTVRFDANDG